jgi:hypothetical protein
MLGLFRPLGLYVGLPSKLQRHYTSSPFSVVLKFSLELVGLLLVEHGISTEIWILEYYYLD